MLLAIQYVLIVMVLNSTHSLPQWNGITGTPGIIQFIFIVVCVISIVTYV